MKVGAIIAAAVLVVPMPARAISLAEMTRIEGALKTIHTAAGTDAWDRLRACGIKIEPSFSSIGPKFLDLLVSLPEGPGSNSPLTDITFRWAWKGASWAPDSGWAERLTNDRAPLDWMPC